MNIADETTRSLWMDIEIVQASPLDGDLTTDVVVIGSGIAGLSTAYELSARGRSVIEHAIELKAEQDLRPEDEEPGLVEGRLHLAFKDHQRNMHVLLT
jgi:choline dehydrogenase-like flavoprotein